jgi:hypothetical protein
MKTPVSQLNFDSDEKIEVRDFIVSHVKKCRRYLDFYGNGDMYKIVRRRTNTKVISIDCDPDKKKELNHKDTLFIDLKSFCNSYNRKFDCIWLDYCGSFSQSIVDDLEELYKVMAKKGYLFFTFFVGRENFMPKGTVRKVVDLGTEALIKQLFRANGYNVRKFYYLKYHSTPEYVKGNRKKIASTLMHVYGFTWTKKK